MARTSSHNCPSGMFSCTFAPTNLWTDASCLSATSHPVLFYLILLKIRLGGGGIDTPICIYMYGIFIIWFTVTWKHFREKQRTGMLWIWGAVDRAVDQSSNITVTIPKSQKSQEMTEWWRDDAVLRCSASRMYHKGKPTTVLRTEVPPRASLTNVLNEVGKKEEEKTGCSAIKTAKIEMTDFILITQVSAY